MRDFVGQVTVLNSREPSRASVDHLVEIPAHLGAQHHQYLEGCPAGEQWYAWTIADKDRFITVIARTPEDIQAVAHHLGKGPATQD